MQTVVTLSVAVRMKYRPPTYPKEVYLIGYGENLALHRVHPFADLGRAVCTDWPRDGQEVL